jgi:hypothetical protein
VKKSIRFGIGADPDAKTAIRTYIFPERKTAFLVNRPVLESPAGWLFVGSNGFGRAIIRALFTNFAELLYMNGIYY